MNKKIVTKDGKNVPITDKNINRLSHIYLLDEETKEYYIHEKDGVCFLSHLKNPGFNSEIIADSRYGEITTHDYLPFITKRFKLSSGDFISSDMIRELAIYKRLESLNISPKLYPFTEVELQRRELHIGRCDDTFYKLLIHNRDKLLKNLPDILFNIVYKMWLCHSKHIIYADLSVNNIVFGRELLFIDWGLSECEYGRFFKRKKNTSVQTVTFRSPEIHTSKKDYSQKIDVYSIGMLVLYIHKGFIFSSDKDIDYHFHNLKTIYGIKHTPREEPTDRETIRENLRNYLGNKIDRELIDLLSCMLMYKQENRSDCRELLYHPYFKNRVMNRFGRVTEFSLQTIKVFKNKDWFRTEKRHDSFLFILEFCQKYCNYYETIFQSFELLDIYQQRRDINSDDLVLNCLAVIFISVQIYEICLRSEWVHILEKENLPYTMSDITKKVEQIILFRQGRLITDTLFSFYADKSVTLNRECLKTLIKVYLSESIYTVSHNAWIKYISKGGASHILTEWDDVIEDIYDVYKYNYST